MGFERISKFKSTALVSIMLVFAAIMVLGGVAVGQQSNVEQPVLEISKTMTSGETTVPVDTKEYWDLEIVVTYNDQTDLGDVVVRDTLPSQIVLDDTTASKGSVTTKAKWGATKITWTIGDMSPGDTETLVMSVSTRKVGSGRRATQNFIQPGEYELNRGASVSGTHQSGTITAGPTDPITVYAEGERSRGGMGGGRGGRWR